ncbi:hypothetical protein ACET3Z_021624 [Daucus carota]
MLRQVSASSVCKSKAWKIDKQPSFPSRAHAAPQVQQQTPSDICCSRKSFQLQSHLALGPGMATECNLTPQRHINNVNLSGYEASMDIISVLHRRMYLSYLFTIIYVVSV